MLTIARLLSGVHGGFTRSGGNFRKNNWAKGRLDVGRVSDVKFKKPRNITKYGFPMIPRGTNLDKTYASKFCNMSAIHEQNVRRNGMSVSDKSARDAARFAMSQSVARK